MKDDIISNLNHIVVNEPNKPTIESLIRNDKINQVLNYDKEDYEYLVVDFMNLKDAFVVKSQSHYLSNIKYKKEQIERLIKISNSYKIIITCQMYTSALSKSKVQRFSGGNDLIYLSDFVFSVDEEIEIIKNRWC
jgi:hypothetical protein